MPGVIIKVKGTSREVESDENGRFKIKVEKGNTLVTSVPGYEKKEIVIIDQPKIEILLKEDGSIQMGEVLVSKPY
jgi:hypothetical protein